MEFTRALDETDGAPRLVDCLTLWLSNEMLADDGDWRGALVGLASALLRQTAPVVLVTNEVVLVMAGQALVINGGTV